MTDLCNSSENIAKQVDSPDAASKHSLISNSDGKDREKASKHPSASSSRSATPKNSQIEDMEQDSPESEHSNKSQEIKKVSSLKRQRKPHEWVRRIINREKYDINNKDEKFLLKISNFPTDWGLNEIKDVIFNEYGPVDVLYMAVNKDYCFLGMIELEFTAYKDCRKAFQALHGLMVEEVKLFAEILDSDNEESDDDVPSQPKRKKSSNKPWRPDIDVWEMDPHGLYGFKPQYLASLGIKPPIDRWVLVTNFRCDKSELKEVLELAGQVLHVNIDHRGQKSANVMYSHPLEAVQAVSMLNNHQFYGQNLTVNIMNCPVGTTFLPKALQDVGPGLGTQGKPLRDIVKQYERFVTYKSSFVDTTIFRNPEVLFGSIANESEVYIPKKISELENSNDSLFSLRQTIQNVQTIQSSRLGPSSFNNNNNFISNVASNLGFSDPSFMGPLLSNSGPVNVSGPIGPCGPSASMSPMVGPMGLCGPTAPNGPICGPVGPSGPGNLVGPMSSSMGPSNAMCRPMGPVGLANQMGPVSGPVGPGPMPSFGPSGPRARFSGPSNPMANCPSPMGGPGPITAPKGRTSTVELVNLPLSTTFALLSEKMAQCGQVMSLQLTTPGCAVVQFAQPPQAERCFQQYNKCNVMGNIIEVKFL